MVRSPSTHHYSTYNQVNHIEVLPTFFNLERQSQTSTVRHHTLINFTSFPHALIPAKTPINCVSKSNIKDCNSWNILLFDLSWVNSGILFHSQDTWVHRCGQASCFYGGNACIIAGSIISLQQSGRLVEGGINWVLCMPQCKSCWRLLMVTTATYDYMHAGIYIMTRGFLCHSRNA